MWVVLLSYGLLPYDGSTPYAGSGVWSFVLTFINIRYFIYVHVTVYMHGQLLHASITGLLLPTSVDGGLNQISHL
jgi:hypothetical protein